MEANLDFQLAKTNFCTVRPICLTITEQMVTLGRNSRFDPFNVLNASVNSKQKLKRRK